jgi:hypothetical protein
MGRYIAEDRTPHNQHCGNLKFYSVVYINEGIRRHIPENRNTHIQTEGLVFG